MAVVNAGSLARAQYHVRRADLARDGTEIASLCQAASLHCTPEKYHWNYQANPLQPAWCGLVIEDHSQQIVGTTALFPRRLLVDGQRVRAAVAGDFAVGAGHRVLYPALLLQRAALGACHAGEFDVLFGFPNDAARPVQRRAGYRPVGQVCAGVRLLNTQTVLAQYGRRSWWTRVGAIFDSLVTLISKERRDVNAGPYDYVELPAFDQRFDRFWRDALPRHRVVVERDSAYANWRFLQCPVRKYSLLAAVRRSSGEIGGYVVWSEQGGKARIADLMACEDAFDGLLSAFIRLQRERQAYCITAVYFGDNRLVRRLCRFGFLFRRTRSELLVGANSRPGVLEPLLDANNWYLFEGDSDS
ncbi:MAG: GNAT family N-acetyltransferase [Chlamydiota bacterium]